ncbi:MAG TPA: hypothetical protein VKP69_04945 [Isosphaeraceae bacterium]|nr:hypothetical protein [Isosphaeraceae bacterium]
MAHDDPLPPRDNSRHDASPALDTGAASLAPPPPAGPGATASARTRVEPEPPRSGPSGVGTVLLSCLLALACGMAGAFGFLRYGDQILPGILPARTIATSFTVQPASNESPSTTPAPASPDAQGVESRVDDLVKRVDQINERLNSIQDPSPELAAIQARIYELATKADDEADSTSKGVKQLDDRIADLDKLLKALRNELLVLQAAPNVQAPQARPSGSETVRHTATRPRVADVNLEDEAFGQAVALYKQGKYRDALERFRQLEQTDPNDARVWYFAALSNGFATGKWDGRTADLVEKGIESERAGTPDSSVIDAAFRDLTPATGKDWLAAYRKGARHR